MVEWYAIAFANGETDRYPLSGFKSFTAVNMFNPSLFVNEIMAINDSTISDESGEFDDWFEIYNPEDYPARLEGFYVSDKKDNLTKWQFPASDIEILPGEYIIIWCDEDQEQGATHTNFKLSGNGEFIALVSPDGETVIDSISFPQQQPDISYGRVEDGVDEWGFFEIPSPGAGNQILDIGKEDYLPDHLSIISAYPNPFNPSCTIKFQSSQSGDFAIKIYNLNGQLVLDRSQKIKSNGVNKWTWDGTSSSGYMAGSGLYLLQVSDGISSSLVKIILAK